MTDTYKNTEEYKDYDCPDRNENEHILDEDGTPTQSEGQTEPEAAEPDELEKLRNELAAARADFYNYRQRMVRDRQKTRQLMSEDLVSELLPVLDNLDRALCAPEDGSARDVLIGVRMVQNQFLSVLEGMGVTVVPTENEFFDPAVHEAVELESVDDPEQDNRVVAELLRGYRTPERVLRAAQVRVARIGTS